LAFTCNVNNAVAFGFLISPDEKKRPPDECCNCRQILTKKKPLKTKKKNI